MKHLRITGAELYTPLGTRAVKGVGMRRLHHVSDAVIDIADGVITSVATAAEAPACPEGAEIIDAGGCVVLPGFVDSHTHMVFGGYRPDEFMWRMRGDSYMDIMRRGGGIVSTMDATRRATAEELERKTRLFLDRMHRMGVTTVEGKSGYGLDRDTELRQLQVMRALAADPSCPVDIAATYLGAHAVPPEFAGRTDDYVSWMIAEMLPQARELSEFCDVFCEEGVFGIDQSRRLLRAAADMGYALKVHADEIVTLGGAELACSLGAASADHLLHVSDAGIRALSESDTVATLLPLTAFTLREPYAPARRLIDSGAAVALATDLNPGSCFSGSIPLTFALACIYMHMSVEEAVTAITLNGAAALRRAHSIGSVEPGKKGHLVILDTDNLNMLPYYTGMNLVSRTIKA